MNLWAWKSDENDPHVGITMGPELTEAVDITAVEPAIMSLSALWARYPSLDAVRTALKGLWNQSARRVSIDPGTLKIPVALVECWAAGVTYHRSRDARVEETHGAAPFYQRVYSAVRPELFFKSPGSRVVDPFGVVGLRRDSRWHVPEPELTVILAPNGDIFGYTVGNDLSCRDIEGENPLYLPQAKIFHGSAAIGPSVVLAGDVNPQALTIRMVIQREQQTVFDGKISTSQMRRTPEELVQYLRQEWPIAGWTALMTGTALVPPADFSLTDGDKISITISGIGTLSNIARRIGPDWVDVPPL